MKAYSWWLVVGLAVLGGGVPGLAAWAWAGCSSSSDLHSCVEESFLGRGRPALLTGAPSFTASHVAPGDPIAIVIPVNEFTRSVGVGIRLEDDPDAGRWPNITLQVETDGDEILRLPLEDTDLAPGIYFASSISLEGEEDSEYTSAQGEAPYVLAWRLHAELPQNRCLTDIFAPTFTVVSE